MKPLDSYRFTSFFISLLNDEIAFFNLIPYGTYTYSGYLQVTFYLSFYTLFKFPKLFLKGTPKHYSAMLTKQLAQR